MKRLVAVQKENVSENAGLTISSVYMLPMKMPPVHPTIQRIVAAPNLVVMPSLKTWMGMVF